MHHRLLGDAMSIRPGSFLWDEDRRLRDSADDCFLQGWNWFARMIAVLVVAMWEPGLLGFAGPCLGACLANFYIARNDRGYADALRRGEW